MDPSQDKLQLCCLPIHRKKEEVLILHLSLAIKEKVHHFDTFEAAKSKKIANLPTQKIEVEILSSGSPLEAFYNLMLNHYRSQSTLHSHYLQHPQCPWKK